MGFTQPLITVADTVTIDGMAGRWVVQAMSPEPTSTLGRNGPWIQIGRNVGNCIEMTFVTDLDRVHFVRTGNAELDQAYDMFREFDPAVFNAQSLIDLYSWGSDTCPYVLANGRIRDAQELVAEIRSA